MNKNLAFTAVVVCLLLGGCTLAPEYTRPEAPIPQNWPQGDAYQSASHPHKGADASALKWREFFTDKRLQKVISLALKNNRDLKLAALNVEKARAMYGVQRAELAPSVGVEGSGGQQHRSSKLIEPGSDRTVEQYSVNFGIAAWEIDFFGRIRSLKDQALQQYLATEQARRSARILLVGEVARAYLALAADRENLELARSTLKAQQDSFDLIKKSYRLGFSTEIDLRRAQTQVEAARRDVPGFMQAAAQDKNALDLLAGAPVPEDLLPVDLSGVAPTRRISAGLPSEVLLKRPDIVAAEHQLKGANAAIGAARAAFFPRISLTATFGAASTALNSLFATGTDTWSFAPSVSMPIFDARTWAALDVTEADQKIILTQYEKTIQEAFREVADALAVHGTIDQQLSAQKALVEASARTYRLSNKRYKLGMDTYLSVLDAHRALYAQQQVLISLRLSQMASRVRLYSTLGGGAI